MCVYSLNYAHALSVPMMKRKVLRLYFVPANSISF